MIKQIALYIVSFFFITAVLSQPCTVSLDSLKGQYSGDCKKGKAEGSGTATGVDSYTGNFKNGYPDGQGKYTWKNGSWYEGSWKNGLFEGKGILNKLDDAKPDSVTVLSGFWKKGKYAGKYEKPYFVHSTTNNISDLTIRKITKSIQSDITLTVKNISGGASTLRKTQLPKTRLSNIQSIEGRFEEAIPDENSSQVANKYTLKKITYPFYVIFSFETQGENRMVEKVGVEFFENCSWDVQVDIAN